MKPQSTPQLACIVGSPGAMEALFIANKTLPEAFVVRGAMETDQGTIMSLPGAFIARPRALKLT